MKQIEFEKTDNKNLLLKKCTDCGKIFPSKQIKCTECGSKMTTCSFIETEEN